MYQLSYGKFAGKTIPQILELDREYFFTFIWGKISSHKSDFPLVRAAMEKAVSLEDLQALAMQKRETYKNMMTEGKIFLEKAEELSFFDLEQIIPGFLFKRYEVLKEDVEDGAVREEKAKALILTAAKNDLQFKGTYSKVWATVLYSEKFLTFQEAKELAKEL